MLTIENPSPRVRRIVIDRPDARNALTVEAYHEFADALAAAAVNDEVSVAIVTGAGSAFCAGADRTLLAPDLDRATAEAASLGFRRLMHALWDFPKPLLAAVNGPAVGAGAVIPLHCDVIVFGRGGRLRFPFAELGLAPEGGASALLPALVGHQTAAVWLYSSEWIEADAALRRGLAFDVVSDDELAPRALRLAETIAAHPLSSLIQTKRMLRAQRDIDLGALLTRETEAQIAARAAISH